MVGKKGKTSKHKGTENTCITAFKGETEKRHGKGPARNTSKRFQEIKLENKKI